MNPKIKLIITVLMAAFAVAVRADSTAPADPKADVAALTERFTGLIDLFENRELENIVGQFSEPFQFIAPTGNVATNRATLDAYFEEIYKKDVGLLQRIQINPDQTSVTLVDADHATISGTSNDVYISREGYEYKMTSHWGATAHRVGEEWKFTTLSQTADILRNPMLRAAVDASRLRPLVAGLMGLLIGVIGGWSFFALRRGSKESA